METSDSSLSKQVAVLEQAGYVKVAKDRIGRKPRTWLSLSPIGRTALECHLTALAAITDKSSTPDRGSACGLTQRVGVAQTHDRTTG